MKGSRLLGSVPAFAGVALAVILVLAQLGETIDLRLLDIFQGSVKAGESSPVFIVDVDADTIAAFGWPISPELYALVLQELHDAGAKAIGVDLLFRDQRLVWSSDHQGERGVDSRASIEGEADPEDWLLGRAAAITGAVLGSMRLSEVGSPEGERTFPATPLTSRGRCSTPRPNAHLGSLRPGLQDATIGHVHLVQSSDGVFRRIVDCVPVHDGCARSLTSVILDREGAAAQCGAAQIVPYSRAFEDFPGITMFDLFSSMGTDEGRAALSAVVEGKYVLVGPSDQGVGDLGATPISSFEPLVAVHANRLEAELSGRRISELSRHLSMLVGAALLLAVMWIRLPARGWLAIAAGGVLLGVLASFAAFRLLSTWIPATPFILPVALGALSAAGWGGWQHFRFNQMLTQAFGSYVSPDVLDWLQETDGAALDPTAAERREITVLFSDIAGYTRLSNDLDAEGVMSSLRLYLHSMVAVIQRHGGYLDKINGDGLMVLFGAPKVVEKSAEAAVACAREMLDEVARLQAAWRAITGGDLRIRVGLATGRAFVGNLGGEGHVEYTAIGPVVNLAARLESKAPIGGLLFCRTTYETIGDPPPGEWTEVDLKGYEAAGPVRVYSVPPPPQDPT